MVELILIGLVWYFWAKATSRAARKRGYDENKWFIYGILFGIFALIVIWMKPKLNPNVTQEQWNYIPRKCPLCYEITANGASFCGHCGNAISVIPLPQDVNKAYNSSKRQPIAPCPQCGHISFHRTKECQGCGATLP